MGGYSARRAPASNAPLSGYGPCCTAQNGKRDIYRFDANGANRIPITDTEADEAFLNVVNLLR